MKKFAFLALAALAVAQAQAAVIGTLEFEGSRPATFLDEALRPTIGMPSTYDFADGNDEDGGRPIQDGAIVVTSASGAFEDLQGMEGLLTDYEIGRPIRVLVFDDMGNRFSSFAIDGPTDSHPVAGFTSYLALEVESSTFTLTVPTDAPPFGKIVVGKGDSVKVPAPSGLWILFGGALFLVSRRIAL